jgi:KDO2-lipid IV(A) lauroyltransferase
MKHLINYLFIRGITFPFSLLPFPVLHFLGKRLGSVAYFLMPRFRKRALSNIALAAIAHTHAEIRHIARLSFQNLMITCLEYSKFARQKKIEKIVTCRNPEEANAIMGQGKGVIFFCGHQSNWEVLFLEGTSRMPGVAIGRPIKNHYLYQWILSIREKYGGKIVNPKSAIKEGLRALKNGAFLGIVGDQGMPDSGYASPFFGRTAWTSPIPALLAYRTGVPIIVATTTRSSGKYYIDYSPPIWPDLAESMEREIDRMMRLSLKLLEESIRKNPGEWLWQHNRWKQQTREKLKSKFRYDSLCILMPSDQERFNAIASNLHTLRTIYPREFIALVIPKAFAHIPLLPDVEVHIYNIPDEMLLHDLRFKLIFNFADHPKAKSHYMHLSAFEVITLSDLEHLAGPCHNLSETFTRALCYAS